MKGWSKGWRKWPKESDSKGNHPPSWQNVRTAKIVSPFLKQFKCCTIRSCNRLLRDSFFLSIAQRQLSEKEGLQTVTLSKKWKQLIFCGLLGALFFLVPPPEDLKVAGWHVFGVFAATIVGLILKPLPMGVMALLGMVGLCLARTLTLKEALSGFGNPTIWLVVVAFFISRGIVKTGLGERIAYLFVERFGKKPLFLAYSLIASDLVIAPAMPSNTARAGGILAPIVQSLNTTFGSDPKEGTENKLGNFLVPVVFQCDVVISAVFLTSMAANPMAVSFASDLLGVNMTWGGWLAASCVPALLSLVLYPLVIYKINPPELKETPEAPALARKKLDAMGPLKQEEKAMAAIFLLLIVLWAGGRYLGLTETLTALLGLCLLLLSNVLTWDDVKSEKAAWDTLIWFAILVMEAGFLNTKGMIPWFSREMGLLVSGSNGLVAMAILGTVYFYSHYLFASSTAHVSAMYAAFLSVMASAGAPPTMAAYVLAWFSSLFGCLTHYGSGPAPIFFGAGYVSQNRWWEIGFVLSLLSLLIWGGVGCLWGKVLGMW